MTAWLVEHRRGTAGELHAPDTVLGAAPGRDAVRTILVMDVVAPALVLGSTQADSVVDRVAARSAGVEVVRRRSGGGAVWVAPGDPVWVDVVVPRGDVLWHDDVIESFRPIGRAWRRALATLGIEDTVVHEGPLVRSPWSDLVCFAGIGPGEVLRHGSKLVGISQRRNRDLARFQCALPRRWDPAPLSRVLVPSPPVGELLAAGTGIGPVPTAEIVDALVEELTTIDLS